MSRFPGWLVEHLPKAESGKPKAEIQRANSLGQLTLITGSYLSLAVKTLACVSRFPLSAFRFGSLSSLDPQITPTTMNNPTKKMAKSEIFPKIIRSFDVIIGLTSMSRARDMKKWLPNRLEFCRSMSFPTGIDPNLGSTDDLPQSTLVIEHAGTENRQWCAAPRGSLLLALRTT